MDLRIAAIALANDATHLSPGDRPPQRASGAPRLADFGKVPGLRVEDWTR